jgi:hypothetical protein
MNELNILFSISFFIASAICLNLGLSVYRRAERSFENTNIIVLFMMLAQQLAVSFLQSLVSGASAAANGFAYSAFINGARLTQVLIFAACIFIIVSAIFRFLSESMEREAALPSIRIVQLRYVKWFIAAALLGSTASAIVQHTRQIIKTLQMVKAGDRLFMPVAESSTGFFIALLCIIGMCAQCMTFAYRIKCSGKLWPLVQQKKDEKLQRLSLHSGNKSYDSSKQPMSKNEWKTWHLGFILLIVSLLHHRTRATGQLRLEMIYLVLSLALVLPAIYLKMRFVFFDVILKRGMLLILLFISGCIYFDLCLAAMQFVFAENNSAGKIILIMGGVLFSIGWIYLHGRINRKLDCILFHRPDYSRLISEISREIKRHVETESLVHYITVKLQEIMDAERVTFKAKDSNSGIEENISQDRVYAANKQLETVTLPIRMDRHLFGFLDMGARRGGQRYLSEDMDFLDAIAEQMAGTLNSIELRQAFDLQKHQELRLRELTAQAELKALKAQINPHFLYNALNSLAHLTHNNPDLAEAATLNLASVFRYALNASKRESVTLGEEVDFLKSYLLVEQARFEERLQFEIDIPENLLECQIPPMIIQPLVENAVKHGITEKTEGGKVVIKAQLNGGSLKICVTDNGVGFENSRFHSGHNGVGLENVRSRIKALDPSKSLEILSNPGLGTIVWFEVAAYKESIL